MKILALPEQGGGGARIRTRQHSSKLDASAGHRLANEETELLRSEGRPGFGTVGGSVLRHKPWGLCAFPFLSFLWLFSCMLVHGSLYWGVNLNKLLFVPISVSSCHRKRITESQVKSSRGAERAFCFIRLGETASLRCPNWFTYYRFFPFLLKGFRTELHKNTIQ